MEQRRYTHRHVVTFDETNVVGNVYFAHYLHWQGHCREHFLARHAPGVIAALSDGLALVTLTCAVDFYAESRALDEIEVRMTLGHITGNRIGMDFDYVRVTADPVLLARGRQSVACMRRDGDHLRPTPVPDELRRGLEAFASAAPV